VGFAKVRCNAKCSVARCGVWPTNPTALRGVAQSVASDFNPWGRLADVPFSQSRSYGIYCIYALERDRLIMGNENEEILRIENFAGIREAEIHIKPFTVLIGPSASGKSICAKLAYFFKQVPQLLTALANEVEGDDQFTAGIEKRFQECFSTSAGMTGKFDLRYQLAGEEIWIKGNYSDRTDIIVKCSAYYDDIIKEVKASQVRTASVSRPQFDDLLMAPTILSDLFAKKRPDFWRALGYIPAARNFFSVLDAQIFSVISFGISIDPFIRDFGGFYKPVLSFYGKPDDIHNHGRSASTVEAEERLLHGKLVHSGGVQYIASVDGRRTPVTNSSSGQQSVLPILVAVAMGEKNKRAIDFFIEEPETHLFPTSQRDVVHYFAEARAGRSEDSSRRFFIETHSPYILAAINNLMYAQRICRDDLKKARVKELMGDTAFIDPKDVAAYVMGDGTARPIIDSTTELIDGDVLDSVSGEIGKEFEALMDIEYEEKAA